MASLLGRPSRSYANVDHNPEGLSGVGNLPYHSRRSDERVRTYRPNYGETYIRPSDEGAESSFPFAVSHRRRKERDMAGQRAEIDHILDPEYKSTHDAESSSMAGPSRSNGVRTAGGFAATSANDRKGKSVHSASSIGSLRSQRSKIAGGGVYVDASGKRHDAEFDPFSKVSEMNRQTSRRRSAFGSDRRKGSDESSEDGSEGGGEAPRPTSGARGSFESNGDGRQRTQSDAKASSAVRRKSLLSERGALDGRRSPSIRSSEDADKLTVRSAMMDRKAKSAGANYVRSPLSPNFSAHTGSSYATARTLPTTEEDSPEVPSGSGRLLSPPLGSSASMPPPPPPSQKVEVRRDGSVKVTGFDAPSSPMPQSSATFENAQNAGLKVPHSARSAVSDRSANSRASSDRDRPRPAERRREETFPETPAQTKRREERARAANLVRGTNSLAIDTQLATSRRPLPEIEIVDDDDPRVILPREGQGRYTRVQQTQDHVIRGPFSLALNAQGIGAAAAASPIGGANGERRPSSTRSIPFSTGSGPSSILDEAPNGYLPSRWASGDRLARVTEEERERYRPKEWGGKKGDLAGKPAEWQPDVKDNIKRTMKDFSTSARISLFRAKKKLQRKTDL